MTEMTVPLPDDWCYTHGRREPIPAGGAFRVCGECWHAWMTAEEFAADVRTMELELYGPAEPARDPGDMTFCPLCAHDF